MRLPNKVSEKEGLRVHLVGAMSSCVNLNSLPSVVLIIPDPEAQEATEPTMFLPAILVSKVDWND